MAGFFSLVALLLTGLFLSTFVSRCRIFLGKRRFRYRRVRYGSLVGALVAFAIVGALAPKVPDSGKRIEAGSASISSKTSASSARKSNPESIEYELATIDAGGYVPHDDIRVARLKSLLQQLSQTYSGTPQQIGDQTVKAQEMLKDRGVQESLVDIMTGMNQIFTTANHKQDYAGALAMYVELRDKGESNSEAFKDLQDLVAHLGG